LFKASLKNHLYVYGTMLQIKEKSMDGQSNGREKVKSYLKGCQASPSSMHHKLKKEGQRTPFFRGLSHEPQYFDAIFWTMAIFKQARVLVMKDYQAYI
jgi:hypothetical protein